MRAAQRAGIYSEPILRFFAPQGRHVAPMGVKFGTEALLRAMPNFTPIGAEVQKNGKNWSFHQQRVTE